MGGLAKDNSLERPKGDKIQIDAEDLNLILLPVLGVRFKSVI